MKIESIKDFPSKQAETLQKQLNELDKHGNLKETLKKNCNGNLGEKNSLLNYCLNNWETRGKQISLEWT